MTEHDEQLERMREAVDRKSAAAEAASHTTPPSAAGPGGVGDTQSDLIDTGRQQDTLSPRAKNAGHGKKTADNWNQ
jgi:hypothetical protein